MPNAEAGPRSENRNPMEKSPSDHDVCKQLLQQALQLAPRVGTRILHDGDLFDSLQRAFPEKKLRVIELCKGADRFRKPPTKLISHEAPWRRTLSLHRRSLEPDISPWINWERLSNRQMCSPAPPSRLMISMFGRDSHEGKRETPSSDSSLSKRAKVTTQEIESQDDLDAVAKQLKLEETDDVRKSPNESSLPEIKPIEQLQKSTLKHGPKFLSLTLQERQWLSKIHHNLGHPNQMKLQAVLKTQGMMIASFRVDRLPVRDVS